MLRIAHQAAAGVVLRNLGNGASHVDVDDVGAHAFDHLCGRRHPGGITAEDLNRDRALLLRIFRVLERPVDSADEALRGHHLGHHETTATLPLYQPAEGSVGHAGHRRDDEWRVDRNGSDFHEGPRDTAAWRSFYAAGFAAIPACCRRLSSARL